MGSKRRLAKKIVETIRERHPDALYFYDLFGGGGAVSFAAIEAGFEVFYNEKNKAVANLMRALMSCGVTADMYSWIPRESFHTLKNSDSYISGIAQTCWSFGSGQKYYLYGKEKESLRHIAHNAIFATDPSPVRAFEAAAGVELGTDFLELTPCDRRLRLQKRAGFKLEHLQRLNRVKEVADFFQRNSAHISIYNLDYKDVSILAPNKSVIYLDPPYRGTRKYMVEISHDELYEYTRSAETPCYMSEYDAPFQEVASWNKRCTISPMNNNKQTIERLYCCNSKK
jgi:16S rRNA G966 N2-methylase RsmD